MGGGRGWGGVWVQAAVVVVQKLRSFCPFGRFFKFRSSFCSILELCGVDFNAVHRRRWGGGRGGSETNTGLLLLLCCAVCVKIIQTPPRKKGSQRTNEACGSRQCHEGQRPGPRDACDEMHARGGEGWGRGAFCFWWGGGTAVLLIIRMNSRHVSQAQFVVREK